jgi:aminoglycoside phosphotransferase (APT) family kinase protein
MSQTSEPTQQYQVVAPYVTARIPNPGIAGYSGRGQWMVLGFNQGAVLPADTHPDDVNHLLSGGVLGGTEPMIVPWPAQG